MPPLSVRPAMRALRTTPRTSGTSQDDVQELLDAIAELNGRIHWLYGKLQEYAASKGDTIDDILED